jgi:hypothetical protein
MHKTIRMLIARARAAIHPDFSDLPIVRAPRPDLGRCRLS